MNITCITMDNNQDLNERFISFYVAFRNSELIKRGKDPLDKNNQHSFNEMMLSDEYDAYFLQSMDFYGYIAASLNFEEKHAEGLKEICNVFGSLDWMTDEDEDEYRKIKDFEKELNDNFLSFYYSFRTCSMLKNGMDSDNEEQVHNFDNYMSFDSSYRRDFYDYVCDSLFFYLIL